MNKKHKIIFITLCTVAIAALIIVDVCLYKYFKKYNENLLSLKVLETVDYDTTYDHLLIKNVISTDKPVKFNDKDYIRVKYVKQEYKSHIGYDYEKKWNGRFWYQEKKAKKVWEWETVKQITYCNTKKVKFANVLFNKGILDYVDYKLLVKKEKDSIRNSYYGIENNKEVVMYFKNWNNGKFDKMKIYNSYNEAINDLYISVVPNIICIDLLILLFYILILYGYSAYLEQ